MASTSNDIVPFNYSETKERYKDSINTNTELMTKHPFSTDTKIQDKINLIQNNNATEPDLAVLNLAGKYKLFRKRNNLLLEVLSVEEAFDVILEKHIAQGHATAAIVYRELSSKMSIPTFAVSWLVSACNVCQEKKVKKIEQPVKVYKAKDNPVATQEQPRPQVQVALPIQPERHENLPTQPKPQLDFSSSTRSEWRLVLTQYSSFIQSSTQTNTRSCYLLILRQIDTNFLLLRPIFESPSEFAMELTKIFTEFGYPTKLYISKLMDFFVSVFRLVHAINPAALVTLELVKKTEYDFFDNDELEVMTEIRRWINMMDDAFWDQCCHIVQYKLNTRERSFTRMDTKETCTGIPFNMFFNFKATREINWINPKTK